MTDGPARVLAPAIESVTADDRAGMHGWFALMVVCHGHDSPALPPPCPLGHANRFSWPGFGQRAWIVRDERPLSDEIEAFLAAGDAPIYFGFGSVRATAGRVVHRIDADRDDRTRRDGGYGGRAVGDVAVRSDQDGPAV